MISNEIRIIVKGSNPLIFRNIECISVIDDTLYFEARGVRKEICKVSNGNFTIRVSGIIDDIVKPSNKNIVRRISENTLRAYDIDICGRLPLLQLEESKVCVGIALLPNSKVGGKGKEGKEFLKYMFAINGIIKNKISNINYLRDAIPILDTLEDILKKVRYNFVAYSHRSNIVTMEKCIDLIRSTLINEPNSTVSSVWISIARFEYCLDRVIKHQDFRN